MGSIPAGGTKQYFRSLRERKKVRAKVNISALDRKSQRVLVRLVEFILTQEGLGKGVRKKEISTSLLTW